MTRPAWLLHSETDYLHCLGEKQTVYLKSQNAWEKCYPGLPNPELRIAATKWVSTLEKANGNLNLGRNKHERIYSRVSKGTTTNSQSKSEADRISSFNKVFEEPFAPRKTKKADLIQMSSQTETGRLTFKKKYMLLKM